LSDADLNEINEVIGGLYPKYSISESCYKELYSIMQKDKKNQSGKINCTLLTSIGQCRIDNICTEDELCDSLRYYSSL
jgi:3-dehydroquinate synthase